MKLAQILQTLTHAQHSHRRPVIWFHGGLSKAEKDLALKQFLSLEPIVMVATNAFGMGIDKSSIRVVIHFQLPSNLENYSQEIGRAGRDGLPAQTFLLYEPKDWQLQLEMAKNQPNHGYKMQQLKNFLLTKSCRARTLATYFGDDILDCHCCDICLTKSTTQLQPPPALATRYYQLRRTGCPHISTLKLIALTQPRTYYALLKIPGIGAGWIARWGAAILSLMRNQDSLASDSH